MNVTSLQPKVVASDIAPEQLAGNTSLTKREKIAEASRQFEAVLLRQILQSTQKTVIQSKYADNSTAAGIYRDEITTQLADSMSKSGAFGLARTFERQLTQPEDVKSGIQNFKPEIRTSSDSRISSAATAHRGLAVDPHSHHSKS